MAADIPTLAQGVIAKIMDLTPGFGGAVKDPAMMEAQQERLLRYRIIMDSMTEQELDNPKIIKHARIERIARGSGATISDVRQLLKQYNTSKKAIKGMMGNRKMRRQLMKQMGSGDFNI